MEGLFIGIFCFVMISIFYPFVKKQNSCFMERFWPLFLIAGIGSMLGSVFVQEVVWSAMLSITGIMFLWSMIEIQEKNSHKLYETLHINDAEFLCNRSKDNQNSEL